jgi:hypothetical protein
VPIKVNLPDGRVVHFPDGMPPDQIAAEVRKLAPAAPQERALIDIDTAKVGAGASTLLDTATDALPNVGGMVGSFVGQRKAGKVGSAVGSGVGGAVGDVARQGINAIRGRGEPMSLSRRAASVGAAGATQAAADAAVSTVVAPAAKAVYGVAMRPLKALRDKYGLRTLVNEGFERGIMPTQGGVKKAAGQMADSRAAQDAMATAYDARPTFRLSTDDAADRGLGPLVTKGRAIESATGAPAGVKRINLQRATVEQNHPAGMSATEMMGAKRAADAVADPAYTAAMKPGGKPIEPGSKAEIAKGWSKGYRETLNDAVGPEFAKQGQTTKTLMGLQRMADYAADRPEMASNIMSVVGGAASGDNPMESMRDAMIYRAILSPRLQAGAALGAVPAARYGTRALDAATGSNAATGLREMLMRLLAGERED